MRETNSDREQRTLAGPGVDVVPSTATLDASLHHGISGIYMLARHGGVQVDESMLRGGQNVGVIFLENSSTEASNPSSECDMIQHRYSFSVFERSKAIVLKYTRRSLRRQSSVIQIEIHKSHHIDIAMSVGLRRGMRYPRFGSWRTKPSIVKVRNVHQIQEEVEVL